MIRAFLAAALVTLSVPAAATPDREAQVADRLLAYNDEALFVLRQTGDNVGFHTTYASELFLVEIPLDGSAPIHTLLLSERVDSEPLEEDDAFVPRIVHRQIAQPDVFALLERHKAHLVPVASKFDVPREWTASEQGDALEFDFADRSFRMEDSAAEALVRQNLSALAASVTEQRSSQPGGTARIYNEALPPDSVCRAVPAAWPLPGKGGPLLAARVTCRGEDWRHPLSIIVPVASARIR